MKGKSHMALGHDLLRGISIGTDSVVVYERTNCRGLGGFRLCVVILEGQLVEATYFLVGSIIHVECGVYISVSPVLSAGLTLPNKTNGSGWYGDWKGTQRQKEMVEFSFLSFPQNNA